MELFSRAKRAKEVCIEIGKLSKDFARIKFIHVILNFQVQQSLKNVGYEH